MNRCTRCGDARLVFPLHGVEHGGPLVCPSCAQFIEDDYAEDRERLLSWYGLGNGGWHRRPASPMELTLELLKDVLVLTHPDMHPPERAALAHRVTAELTALKPYLRHRPAPVTAKSPPPPGPDKNPSRDRPLPTYPCIRCLAYPPMYYCASCRAEWERRCRAEVEQENAKRRARYQRRHKRLRHLALPSVCAACGHEFKPKRKDAKHCSPACRQRAYRLRGTSKIEGIAA